MNARHVKIFVITLFVFFMINLGTMAANGAAPSIEQARLYGGSGTDRPLAIQQTKDGGYIVA